MAPRILVAVIGLAMALGHAQAQAILGAEPNSYPNRPIRIIVPFPPGGPADMIARLVAQRMSEDWGQPVLVENRAGGNTAIGAQVAARSAPDGYTLLAAMDTTMVMNPLVTPNLPYDPLRDLAPITLLIRTVALVVVRSDGPKTIKELIAKAKANPGKLNMGAGTITSRLGALQFAKAAEIDVQLVPFKGSAEIGQAVLAGTVDFALDSTGTSLPLIEGGRYRALAKYSNRPLPILPDLPSLSAAAELPALEESSTWVRWWRPPAHLGRSSAKSIAKSCASTPTPPCERSSRRWASRSPAAPRPPSSMPLFAARRTAGPRFSRRTAISSSTDSLSLIRVSRAGPPVAGAAEPPRRRTEARRDS
jgi:tripartite-type tricarboxylate transporter receptor subunit TctC